MSGKLFYVMVQASGTEIPTICENIVILARHILNTLTRWSVDLLVHSKFIWCNSVLAEGGDFKVQRHQINEI